MSRGLAVWDHRQGVDVLRVVALCHHGPATVLAGLKRTGGNVLVDRRAVDAEPFGHVVNAEACIGFRHRDQSPVVEE